MELLLNMSRLEGSMIHLEPQVRSLKKTILGAVNTVIMKAVDKNIELRQNWRTVIQIMIFAGPRSHD